MKTLALTLGTLSSMAGVAFLAYDNNKSTVPTNDKLHFAFELVRHGARAPDDPRGFNVPKSGLTGQGMRQRYLLGASNR
jgi:hypothetical protein